MGNVPHTADDAVMNAILSDMNAVEEAIHQPQAPVYIPPPPPPPPMQPQFQQPEPSFSTHSDPYAFDGMMQDPSHHYMQQPYQQQQQAHYEPVEEPAKGQQHTSGDLKKNSWSLLFDEMRDPLVVGLLVCLFSLPALHTWLAKRATWAYKVGGSLSWLGFLIQFALVGGIFATYRQIMRVMNMYP